ncbi:hypothetical protein D3C71_1488230 [compost metagenome]
MHGAGNGAVADLQGIQSIALVDAVDDPAAYHQRIVACALHDTTADAAGQHLQAVIAGTEDNAAGAAADHPAIDHGGGGIQLQATPGAGEDAAIVDDQMPSATGLQRDGVSHRWRELRVAKNVERDVAAAGHADDRHGVWIGRLAGAGHGLPGGRRSVIAACPCREGAGDQYGA